MELRDLYDKDGNKTELTYYKGEQIPEGYYPMVVMIAIENNEGKFLMQKRVKSKGGDWGVTGGHPKSGETPKEGIITEVKEELGIDINEEIIEEFKSGCDGEDCYVMYYAKLDIDIKKLNIQQEELSEVRWFSIDELNNMVARKKLNKNQVDFFIKCKKYLEKRKLESNNVLNVRNNYKECLTNLACSIRKYFDLEYKHNTLEYIDKILKDSNPKNVVLILFDGMGSRILDRTLNSNDFLIKNKLKEITSVFPATTTAATISIRTGLNPVEHGWLGWNTYIAPIDKTITLFLNKEKGKNTICEEFLNVKNKLVTTNISKEIRKDGKYKSIELFPFGENKYENLDDMLNIILNETKKDGKKYIYAYDDEPDGTMHEMGADSEMVKKLIKIRNKKLEELSEKLEDTLLIVVADHGHIKVDHIYLNDYPELINMLERTTSIEQRAISFKVKEEYMNEFKNKFNILLGEYFNLYSKFDVKKAKLFGDGEENEFFDSAIGDYIAIAEKSNKCLISDADDVLYSQHAGYTDDEIYVPLIVVNKTKKLVK